jgi:5-methyltetrahydrofolate--homocysteine methyltransferase
MEKITTTLKTGKILVSDGGWGTLLQQMGLKAGDCPELWNDTHRESVLKVAQAYVNAGADMIETNSFGGSRIKLAGSGLESRTVELNRKAAEISRQAAGTYIHVLGSIGPTGKIVMMGDIDPQELYDVFAQQAIALVEGGADTLIIETISELEEATTAIKAARENTNAEIICTMTFSKTVDGEYRTMMGVSPHEMVPALIDAGAHIIGANCGNGIEDMVGLVEVIRSVNRDIPVLIHANAGLPVFEDGKTVYRETPEQMAGFVEKLINAGANIIGGCCGTTPDHIARIKEKLHELGLFT